MSSSNDLRGLAPLSLFILFPVFYNPAFIDGEVAKWLLLAVAAIACCLVKWKIDRLFWISALFLAYVGLSLLWSPDWRAGLLNLQKIFVMWCVFNAFRGGFDRMPEGCLITALITVSLGLIGDYEGGFGNENFTAEYLLLSLPWIGYGGWKYRNSLLGTGFVAVFALVSLTVLLSGSKLGWFALLGFATGFLIWRRQWYWLTFLSTAALSLFLWKQPQGVIDSLMVRAEFSTNTLAMWLNSPLLGQGIGAFNHLYPAFDQSYVEWFGETHSTLPPMYFAGAAHNEYAQFLAEFGLVGAAIIIAGLLTIERLNLAVCMGLLLALISFPLQSPQGWLFYASLGLCASRSYPFTFLSTLIRPRKSSPELRP